MACSFGILAFKITRHALHQNSTGAIIAMTFSFVLKIFDFNLCFYLGRPTDRDLNGAIFFLRELHYMFYGFLRQPDPAQPVAKY